MSDLPVYRDYFDIDPEYFPAVNKAVIDKNPDMSLPALVQDSTITFNCSADPPAA